MVKKGWVGDCWQLGVAVLLTLIGVGSRGVSTCAFAQQVVTADPTLGTTVTRNGTSFEITGGTTVGGKNLFHSFSNFSVPVGGTADFLNTPTISNIFARVTGGSFSNIQGLIQAKGTANLFLMNPNGILFGPRSQLNIGGSFVGTTASAIAFPGGGEFSLTSAVDPANSLLSVNPSAFLFNQIAAQPITNQSIFGLQVPDNQSLLLLGGDVRFDGGSLQAPGGEIDIGAVAGEGTVGLSIDGKIFSLSFPESLIRANISLTKGSLVDASGIGGGNIQVQGKRVTLSNESSIFADTQGRQPGGKIFIQSSQTNIESGSNVSASTASSGNAGNVKINATDSLELSGQSSLIGSVVTGSATGKGGDITIETAQLSANGGSQIFTITSGQGQAGNVTVTALNSIELKGTGPDGQTPSGIGITVQSGAKGNAGNVTIKTGRLSLTSGAQINNITTGVGNGGNLNIHASEVELVGTSTNVSRPSALSTQVQIGASGNGGNLTLNAERISIREGALISTGTFSDGNAGNLIVRAPIVELIGTATNTRVVSSLSTQVQPGAKGHGGDLLLESGQLLIRDGAQVNASTFGFGNAGDITVRALENAEALDVNLIGGAEGGRFPSGFGSQVAPRATGKGGNINIEARRFIALNGAESDVSTFGRGNAGTITIHASEVELIGISANQQSGTGLSGRVEQGAEGKGGSISLKADRLIIRNGAQISVSTFGSGDGGKLTIQASEIDLIGTSANGQFLSGLSSQVESGSQGNGGEIVIETGRLIAREGAQVSTSTFGSGNAGRLNVKASEIELVGTSADRMVGSGLFTMTQSQANANDLSIGTSKLIIRNGAQISSATIGAGQAGNLTINTSDLVEIIGTSADGEIKSQISAQSLGKSAAGNIIINAKQDFNADHGQVITAATQAGGGNITINAKDIRLRNNSDIRTNSGGGNGGNIFLTANTIVALEDSDILAFAPAGRGGNIAFNTRAFLSDPLYRPTPPTTDRVTLDALDSNARVDVNASGTVSGAITGVPDITFIQNSLTELSQQPIDANALIANSCIARSNKQQGTFTITGSGGLPNRPGDAPVSSYPTGTVRNIQGDRISRPWHKGDPIVEPQGVYQLPNGHLVLSRECVK